MHFHSNAYKRRRNRNIRAKESHNSVVEFEQNKIATMGNCVLVLLLQTGVVTFCDNQGSEDNADQDREGFYIILRAKHCTLLIVIKMM